MQTIVMSGGYGSRMGGLNPHKSKMLMEIRGQTLLAMTLSQLKGTDIVFVTRPELINASIPYLDSEGLDYEFVEREDSFRRSLAKATSLCNNEFFVVCSHQPIEDGHISRFDSIGLTGYRTNHNGDMLNLGRIYAHMPYRLNQDVIRRMEDDDFQFTVEHYINPEDFEVYETRFLPEADYPEDFERLKRFFEGLKC